MMTNVDSEEVTKPDKPVVYTAKTVLLYYIKQMLPASLSVAGDSFSTSQGSTADFENGPFGSFIMAYANKLKEDPRYKQIEELAMKDLSMIETDSNSRFKHQNLITDIAGPFTAIVRHSPDRIIMCMLLTASVIMDAVAKGYWNRAKQLLDGFCSLVEPITDHQKFHSLNTLDMTSQYSFWQNICANKNILLAKRDIDLLPAWHRFSAGLKGVGERESFVAEPILLTRFDMTYSEPQSTLYSTKNYMGFQHLTPTKPNGDSFGATHVSYTPTYSQRSGYTTPCTPSSVSTTATAFSTASYSAPADSIVSSSLPAAGAFSPPQPPPYVSPNNVAFRSLIGINYGDREVDPHFNVPVSAEKYQYPDF